MIAPKMASACMRLRSSAALRHCLSRRIGLCLVLLICITVGCAAFSVIVSPENEAAALRAIELYDQARQAEKLDNVNKAVELYRRSLDAYEWLPGTYNNLAMAELRATGDRSRALAILKRGAAVASELHDNKTLGAMYNNMGFIVRQEAPLSVTHCLQAIEYYNQALDAVPDFVDALFNKASALRAMKENPQAAELLYRVLQLRPDHHSALLDLGSIFFEWGDVDTAVQYQDAAISVAPSMALKLGIMHNKGHFLRASGALEEALRVHEDALAMAPTDPMALTDVVIARRPLCVWEHREELLDRMLVAVTKPNLAVLLPYDSTLLPVTNAIRKQLAVALSRAFRQSTTLELLPLRDIAVTTEARRPLRVGYLSFDFRDHPMGHLTLGLLESHDVERVQVHCYSYGTNDKSEWRHRAERRCHTFVDGAALSDLELAQRIALDEVDILIDLMAHTTGARLGISALRPSRVNVNYLGFPGTMGASFTDFVLVDRFVVPPEYANDSMTEQIVYLPHTYQVNEYELDIGACSAADDECMRAIRREEGLPEDAVILCNFNTIDKMEPVSFGVWMNVLRQVPNSILWLLQPSKKHASRIERSLRREAEARGIDSSRIVFAPRVSKRRHLARITIADVFLDSFIYNAHSTASDALWANVPLLTLWGDSFPSRVAGSLLSNLIGVPDLVPTSIKEYENLGVLLASSPELRNRIRAELARHSFTAPLFDTKRTTADIETAYELMHDIRHRLNHAPQLQRYHISVGSSQSDFLRSEDRTAAFVRTAVVSGMAKQESRQYTEARSIYERILRSQPNEIDARHLLGVTLHQLGNHHQALEVLDEVRRSHPNVALFRYNLALVLLALHRVTAAKAELREALQLDPTYHAALFQLTDILLRESAFPDVTDMYDKLGGALFLEHSDHSEHVPDDIREQALLQYSFALTKSSRSDDALRILRSMVERHPNYFRATFNLAAIFIERGYYSMGDEWQVRAAVNEARHAFSTRGQFFTKYKRPHARKVVVFYCHEYGQSWWDAWGPSSLRTGLGGSEEAVVYLSRELQRLGFWVEVYGDPPLEDITAETSDRESVKWYPHYAYDPDDREVDVFVAWRYHIALAVGALSRQKFFWVHDVPSEDATHSRLLRETVDGILCVSHFQASLFPTELQTKIIVTSNALDPAHFVELDRMARHRNHRFVYGSSPGRGLYDLLLVWPRIRTHIPDATLRVFYGFTPAFLSWGRRNIKDFQTWKQAIDQMLKQPGVDYVGLVDHGTLANEYASAGFYLYPTTYSETSCVSLMKAMANGAIPITSRFPSSALRETCGEFDLGPRSVLADSSPIDDHEWLDLWVRSIVDAVKHPNETEDLRTRMIQFARHKYQWANVAAQWRLLFTDGPV